MDAVVDASAKVLSDLFDLWVAYLCEDGRWMPIDAVRLMLMGMAIHPGIDFATLIDELAVLLRDLHRSERAGR